MSRCLSYVVQYFVRISVLETDRVTYWSAISSAQWAALLGKLRFNTGLYVVISGMEHFSFSLHNEELILINSAGHDSAQT